MKILSFHIGHDSNFCYFNNNEYIHIESERLSRVKHDGGGDRTKYFSLLKKYFNYCDVLILVVSSIEFITDFLKVLNIIPQTEITLENYIFKNINIDLNDNKYINYKNKKIYFISHHIAHLSYAFYTRPKSIENCDNLAYDGWGWETDKYFLNSKNNLNTNIFGLGFLWSNISTVLFNNSSYSGKVMGLSARGKIDNDLYAAMENYCNNLKKIEIVPKHLRKQEKNKYYDFIYKYDTQSENIAKTLQVFSEDKIFKYLNENKTSDNLCISGGIGLNGYINQKLIDKNIYKNVYIPPACGDCGLSIGGVLFVNKKRVYKNIAYIGSEYEIELQLLKDLNYKKYSYDEIYDIISDAIIDGKIIGWYQGRSESGPRALGNRSILCDPRTEEMKNYLNQQVKHREWFRPFAPAILKEYVTQWFENITEDKYMLKIAKYKKGMGEKAAGVCHVDYTGRVQTVSKEDNKHFYNLINEFYKKTDIPILLNTSFNDQEPIIDSPEDAINTFKKTNIDILVLKDYIIKK